MSNFWQRLLSGIAYVSIVLASILVHPIFFGVLFGLITMYAVYEFHHLMHSQIHLNVLAVIGGGLLFAAFRLGTMHQINNASLVIYLLTLWGLLMMITLIIELFAKAEDPIRNWGNLLASQIMIALPFALMNLFSIDFAQGEKALASLFIIIWINDTGAYCVGSLTAKRKNGNHKMFPRVSPNKSWEGLIGGIVFALLSGYVYFRVGWFDTLWIALVFTLIISIFGTLGDLMESLFKRTLGVKDSGKFMPGHGGVLDRFDSILLAAPSLLLVYLLLF